MLVLVGLSVAYHDSFATLQWTTYDEPLSIYCSEGYGINNINSRYNGWYKDRKWSIGCKQYVPPGTAVDCHTEKNINDYDKMIDFQCNSNEYISKLESVHDNHFEDRKWSVTCCSASTFATAYCRLTYMVNDYEENMDFTSDSDEVIIGFNSFHDNGHE